MRYEPSISELTCSDRAASQVEADLLAVPFFEADDLSDLPGLDAAAGGEIARAVAQREFKAKPWDVFVTRVTGGGWRAGRILLVGVGPRQDYSTERARRLATTAALVARQRGAERLAIVSRGSLETGRAVQAMTEGVCLADFEPASHKTKDRDEPRLRLVVLLVEPQALASARPALERGRILGVSSNVARGLANEPGNDLPPRVFADRAVEATKGTGLRVEVLDETAIRGLKMGLLLGVAQGSAEPPRVIVLRHEPPGVATGPVLGLVGKGITFDTGGISIKPAEGMDRMKDDMSGGAAVVAAMRAIALLGVPVRVVGVVPSAENMPGSRALRPGDVLTAASGTTVEVNNTDAEGRLVLGDGLWYAQQLGATHLVNVATLTGACVVALGKTTTGLFGTPAAWVESVRAVAEEAGDRAWPMPVFDDYRELMKSDIADILNTGGRAAGAITAAMFLKEFTAGLPWVHMDIAGTAWADEAKPYQVKGPTGVAVRTLAGIALSSDAWRS